jgi:hypothetical protein
MFFIYVSELHEEAPMDKKHWKREKEVYTGKRHVDLQGILQRSQGEKNCQRETELVA